MTTCGDSALLKHLSTGRQRGTYISPLSLNQLISNIATVMTREIVTEVTKSKFFSLLADETTDTGGVEQLSVCLRYVTDASTVRERFLSFQKVYDITGAGLAKTLLRSLELVGLNAQYIVGQEYDGAGAMSGQYNGVQKHIQDKYPASSYVHCMAHSLNLCIEKSCSNK